MLLAVLLVSVFFSKARKLPRITPVWAAFSDMTESVVHIVAKGDLVVTHFISSGTFTGEMNGLEPSGKKG